MYLAGRWADRQLSRLELVITVIILGLVLTVLMQKMLKLFAAAEYSLLTTTVVNINTAIQYRAAWYLLNGDYNGIAAMQQMNPFGMSAIAPDKPQTATAAGMPAQMLAGIMDVRAPANYLGELAGIDAASIDGGSWYFNLDDRTLVYRVDNIAYFDGSLPGPARVGFSVEIDFEDLNSNNRFEPLLDEYRGIRLRTINEYEWRL